ncbi:MAG: ABC transporter ATP-binding protein [Shinella sp.]|nr:MAG: ABC transporter ATP-binding protein [Shinella sp.]
MSRNSVIREKPGRVEARPACSIHIEALSKSYGLLHALDNVDLFIASGEFVAMLGPSGSGKSTLLMAVAGFMRPDGGRILLDGEDVVRLPANQRDFGVVFQNYALFPHMTVFENVAFPLRLRKVEPGERRARVEAALDVVKLGGVADRHIAELSGGQRQRVALARAIVFEPKVLLMDEPLSALDKTLREEMQIEIRELHDKLKITTLYVTHDQREALTIADRVAVMDRGRIVQIDTPQAIYRRPGTEFVARFIGEAAIIPAGGVKNLAPMVSGGRKLAMIRSEDFHLAPAGSDADWCQLSGRLHNAVFQGDSWLLRVQLPDGQMIDARARRQEMEDGEGLRVGAPITLHARRDEIHLL